jgi:EAL domain-containing protein (putative c-di-GMP-specific phosphodiesterase class I)
MGKAAASAGPEQAHSDARALIERLSEDYGVSNQILPTICSRSYSAGEKIFRIGDRGRNAYVIERGLVQISDDRDGAETVMATLGPGDVFGEMSMIDDAPRSATATASEDTELIVIRRSRFSRPLQSADPMMTLILRVVLARLREAQDRLLGIGTSPPGLDRSLDEVRRHAIERITAEKDMRKGLEAEEFELHYQPIVSLDHGHIGGFEALMRWRKHGEDFVSPEAFVPLAEETGLMVELGRWALKTGLRDQLGFAQSFKRAYPDKPAPFVSVNVSSVQLGELSEIDTLATIIAESGVDPAQIKLEITESLMVADFQHAVEALTRLSALGVSLAIDDFGTGYSSLSYLHQFPLNTLKIDRAFVTDINGTAKGRSVVGSIIQLAHALDMDVVAEGIEERAQFETLHELGCQYGQGYLMAKPQPVADAIALIDSRPTW